ncbi:MAG: WD40 repeat domain-containing protein, partial [bacterium]
LKKQKNGAGKGHECCVSSIAFRPDGLRIATGCMDKTVKMWAAKTGDLKCTLKGHKHPVNAVAFSHDNKLLASGSIEDPERMKGPHKPAPSNDKTIILWDAHTGATIRVLESRSYDTFSLSFSADNTLLASGGWDYTNNRNTIRLWSVESGELVRPFDGHNAKIMSIDFSPNGRLLVSGGDDKSVKVWRVE